MKNFDIKEIADHALSQYPGLLFSWLPGGRIMGHEFKCGSIQGEQGESLSVNVRTGKWADFSTDDRGGDPVSLYASIRGLSQFEAARELAVQFGFIDPVNGTTRPAPKPRAVPAPKPPPEPDFIQIIPAPEETPNIRHPLGKPARVWRYRTIDGGLIGYVLRFNKPDGKKEIVPLCYGTFQGKDQWKFKHFTEPRPLYNLPALADPKKQVLIVEGEKCADHAATLFPKLAVVSWPGGGKATKKVDWSPLAGRKVTIWPDADKPGFETAKAIAETLRGIGCAVKFIQPPTDAPEGWDVADSDLTPDTALAWVKGRVVDELPEVAISKMETVALVETSVAELKKSIEHTISVIESLPPPSFDGPPRVVEPPLYEGPPPEAYADEVGYPEPDPAPLPAVTVPDLSEFVLDRAPFRCLGYDRGTYFYFAKGTQQIFSMTAASHNKSGLLQLADQGYWKMNFGGEKRANWDVDSAADAMMRGCERAGIFTMERMRGRGAWWDAGRVVVHLGDRLIVDGVEYKPAEFRSYYIYEAGQPIATDILNPLTNKQANQAVSIFQMLPWRDNMSALLAAGWCVIAHIGGVMHWRPHIWIIGKKGTGKSWVMTNVVQRLLGQNHIFLVGNTSEAGIRQTLQHDSIPVLFDEAEGETIEAQANIQRCMQLIRQSSSETGGRIAKGTPGGKAQRYNIRSCFAMSSVNASLVQQSDKSRMSVLELSPDHRHTEFDLIEASVAEILTDKYVAGFYARAIKLAGIIRENARVFSAAAASVLGEQRAGDQIGTLLAGAYSLFSDKAITFEDAKEWIKKQDWEEKKAEIKGQDDGLELFAYMLEKKITIKLDGQNGMDNFRIGYLIDIARGEENHDHLSVLSAKKALKQIGFRVESDGVWVANNHAEIKDMLKGHKHSVNWNLILKGIRGAKASGKTPIYFTSKLTSTAAVFVPFVIDN